MPELPEVETMVRGIRPACLDRVIEELEFVAGPCRPMSVSPSRTTIARAVAGRQVTAVRRMAKRIVMDLDSGASLVIEPRMTGLMLVAEPPTIDHRRLVWHFRRKRGRPDSVEFWDRRGLGTISLLTAPKLKELAERLGRDALQMSFEDWRTILQNTDRPVKAALLDQKLVGGIGNLYASEILHLAGVSPKRKASRLKSEQVVRIAESTLTVLETAIRYEGSTLGDGTYRNVLNQDGSYQNEHRVYQRTGEPCLMCQVGIIRRIVQAQRATFYCPSCQK